jgi:blocked-early-in-transport protein 1
MARQGDRVAVLKVAGIIIAVVVLGYWILSWIF